MSAVIDAAYRLARAYPGGAASLAPRIGKNSTSLSQEVACTGTAKLGLQTAVDMTLMAKSVGVPTALDILNTFATECGCVAIPHPTQEMSPVNVPEIFHRLSGLSKEFADFLAVTSSHQVMSLSENQKSAIMKEGAELMAATQAAMARFHHEFGAISGGAES